MDCHKAVWLWYGFDPWLFHSEFSIFPFDDGSFRAKGHANYTVVSWRPTVPSINGMLAHMCGGFPNNTFKLSIIFKTLTSSMSHLVGGFIQKGIVLDASPAIRLDVSVKQRGCFSWCGTQGVMGVTGGDLSCFWLDLQHVVSIVACIIWCLIHQCYVIALCIYI